MIAIVDYGVGNVTAIANQLERLSVSYEVVKTAEQLQKAEKIILPGVGSFDDTMARLNGSGLRQILDEKVLGHKVPCLGVCIGMQIMTTKSAEGKEPGLGWFEDSEVVKIKLPEGYIKPGLPHMGWNQISSVHSHPILKGLDMATGFYFLHSYRVICSPEHELLTCNFGETFPCAIVSGNVFGFQFHPEKSHDNGLTLFRNFANL